MPSLTNLGKHPITLTTEERINSKLYSLPYAMQKEGIREPSRSSDVVFVVIIRKPDELKKSVKTLVSLRRSQCLTLS